MFFLSFLCKNRVFHYIFEDNSTQKDCHKDIAVIKILSIFATGL